MMAIIQNIEKLCCVFIYLFVDILFIEYYRTLRYILFLAKRHGINVLSNGHYNTIIDIWFLYKLHILFSYYLFKICLRKYTKK